MNCWIIENDILLHDTFGYDLEKSVKIGVKNKRLKYNYKTVEKS